MKALEKSKIRLMVILVVLIIMLLIVSIFQLSNTLTVVSCTETSFQITQPIRIVHLSDLHSEVFGTRNANLLKICTAENPDLILLTGDLINMNEKDTSVAEDLISGLISIAPVYVSMGNHEVVHEQNFGTDMKAVFEAAGATVLEREYEDVTINNQAIRLGGIYGYCLPEKFLETGEADSEECTFLSEFQNTDRYTILMCHMPVCWMMNDGLDEWDVDCVFSGHAHGGQIILPFIGGLYAPDMGLFPGKLEGTFDSKDRSKHLVLSSGLGSGSWIPRINNRPEVVVVDITP